MQFFTTITDDISGLSKSLALRSVDGLIIYDILQEQRSRNLLSIKNSSNDFNSLNNEEQNIKKKKFFDFESFIHNLELCRSNNRKWRRFSEIPFKCNAFSDFKNTFPEKLDDKSKEMIKKNIFLMNNIY